MKKQYNNIVYVITFLVCMAFGAFERSLGINISSRALELFGFIQIFIGSILCVVWACEGKRDQKAGEVGSAETGSYRVR